MQERTHSLMEQAVEIPAQQDWIDGFADRLQRTVTGAYERTGESSDQIADFLNGTWLGHPLHPVLTDLPIGFWTSSAALDLLETLGARGLRPGADATLALGLAGALAAAAAGVTDWQHTVGETRRVGATHAALNSLATLLYSGSLFMRLRRRRSMGRLLSMAGMGVAAYGAYLGGNLAFQRQVGMNHAPVEAGPEDFTPVIDAAELVEGRPMLADVEDGPLMLVRYQDRIYALANSCAHLGGPLAEGHIEDECIVCPWHGSHFRLEDGEVIHGPSAYSQPSFDTRVVNGRVEVRRSR
ncbi:MAG: Rieske (2Fe-2S) protein [Dehalococcoidia bacterium]|nr:Rieske (2Fe-2S) protein [Dehalococcoidia bacterium]